jgi:hypothetical protein
MGLEEEVLTETRPGSTFIYLEMRTGIFISGMPYQADGRLRALDSATAARDVPYHVGDPRGHETIEDITSQKALSKKYGTHYTR